MVGGIMVPGRIDRKPAERARAPEPTVERPDGGCQPQATGGVVRRRALWSEPRWGALTGRVQSSPIPMK